MEELMIRTGLLGTITAAVLLTACERFTGPPSDPMSSGTPTYAVTLNDPHAAFDFFVTTCEEDVVGSGRLHVLSTETISADEDTVMTLHFNGIGTGLGLASGARYRFNDAFNADTHMNGELPVVVSVKDALNLIGTGGTPDLHILTTFHITVNANGIISVLMDDIREKCD
jgi:hypothetical protein